MKRRTKVQKIIMARKSFCCEKKVGLQTIVIYIIKLFIHHLFVCYVSGQTAESNGLNFSEETPGYPGR